MNAEAEALHRPIQRRDLEAKFRELQGEVNDTKESATSMLITVGACVVVGVLAVAFLAGRRKGKTCVAPTRALAKAQRCTRLITKGTLTRTSKAGANRVAFSGRIGSRALSPGVYQATLTATDKAKNTSTHKSVLFTIVKR